MPKYDLKSLVYGAWVYKIVQKQFNESDANLVNKVTLAGAIWTKMSFVKFTDNPFVSKLVEAK